MTKSLLVILGSLRLRPPVGGSLQTLALLKEPQGNPAPGHRCRGAALGEALSFGKGIDLAGLRVKDHQRQAQVPHLCGEGLGGTAARRGSS